MDIGGSIKERNHLLQGDFPNIDDLELIAND